MLEKCNATAADSPWKDIWFLLAGGVLFATKEEKPYRATLSTLGLGCLLLFAWKRSHLIVQGKLARRSPMTYFSSTSTIE